MAKIVIVGRCSGTEVRHSNKSGKDYSVTRWSEVPSMKSVELFGDFGLAPSDEVREYVLEAGIKELTFPALVSNNPVPAPAPAPKK